MGRRRTREEILVDRLLLIYLIKKINETGIIQGVTKLQKLSYLSARDMIDKFCKGFHYTFIRHLKGAFSGQVEKDINQFVEKGLIELESFEEFADSYEARVYRTKGPITLTEYGGEILSIFNDLFRINSEVIQCIDDISERFGTMDTSEIVDFVYSLRTPIAGNKTIRELNPKRRRTILTPPSDKRTKSFFQIDESWAETLEICLDPELYGALKDGIRSAQREPMKPYIPMVD